MKRDILINVTPLETRAAVLEDGTLTEFFLERNQNRGLAGNIYKGKVARVLPGMQAAFVNIGLEKAGFLHVSDFLDDVQALGAIAHEVEEPDLEAEPVDEHRVPDDGAEGNHQANSTGSPSEEPTGSPTHQPAPRRRRRTTARPRVPIEQKLRRNQEIIVQIAKEPIGGKGARLTSFITLVGRYLVYMPTGRHLGVSRRISKAEERARLRAAVNSLRPPQGGFIIRTVCEGVSKRELQRDIAYLTRLWRSIVKRAESSGPATLLYSEPDLPIRLARDLLTGESDRLWCDDRPTFERVRGFVEQFLSRLRSQVLYYESPEPLFDHFGIEHQLDLALERRVPLSSGGYLVFDQAEALTAIDVNTGSFVGRNDQDETVLKTNLEAAEQVVNQLRLRNIGGIIIVDFIDMAQEAHRRRVMDALHQALKRDRARTSVLGISELGLVQMTRKRTRESLEELLTEPCPECRRRGVVKSIRTLAAEMLRAVQREAARRPEADMLVVRINPEIARFLYGEGARALEALEQKLGLKVVLRSTPGLAPGAHEFVAAPAAA